MLRAGHPFSRCRNSGQALLDALGQLEFVAVRTHSVTLRPTTEHFMVLPSITNATDLAVVMPCNIAQVFAVDANGRFDLKTAVAYAKILSAHDLFWYEEAGDPLDYALQAELAPPSAIGLFGIEIKRR